MAVTKLHEGHIRSSEAPIARIGPWTFSTAMVAASSAVAGASWTHVRKNGVSDSALPPFGMGTLPVCALGEVGTSGKGEPLRVHAYELGAIVPAAPHT